MILFNMIDIMESSYRKVLCGAAATMESGRANLAFANR